MIIPMATAAIAIFIIGAEILLLCSLELKSRFAMKYSSFNTRCFVAKIEKQTKFKSVNSKSL